MIQLSDEDGRAVVTQPEISAELKDKARRAQLCCPEWAIKIE